MVKSKIKVLYVEDYPVVQQMYVAALKQKDFVVDVAADGMEALNKLSTSIYDVVILDLLLPNVSGLEILKTFKKQLELAKARPKIIILTDFDSPETVKEVNELGVDAYWIKVENVPSVLAQKVTDLLK